MPIALVHPTVDAFYRAELVDVAPVTIRPKIREALAQGPKLDGANHAVGYFGAEFTSIIGRAVKLAEWLDREFARRYPQRIDNTDLPGLIIWLDVTGFGSDYRMIKAFDAWAQMGTEAPRSAIIAPSSATLQ